jgi:hypothetical protein
LWVPNPLTEDVLAGADVVVTLGRSVGTVDIPETLVDVVSPL